jgi:hypothetical protein
LQEDGSVIGDPVEIDFTEWCKQSGHVFENTSFEVLPHAIQWPGRDPRVKKITLPEGIIIPISHPEYEWFQDLGLFWYTVPIISEMMLEIGGICYTAAPFNVWYMVTEIGSRNFGDAHRYNMLPVIASKIGLDTKKQNTLWKDRAILELNRAVLHSYEKAGASISSHHESSEQFIQFEEFMKTKNYYDAVLENLSKKEREFLDYHATTGDYLDDEELITSSDRVPSGETWIFDGVPGIPKMEFQYETTEENIDEIVHTGYLTINNDPFYGEIYCDNEGNYSLCNFESDESVNLFETYEGLEGEIEAFLSTVCEDLKGDLMT